MRIRVPVSFSSLDPGSGKKTGSGSGMNNQFFGLKYLNYSKVLDAGPDPGWKKIESGMEKFGSRSATLLTIVVLEVDQTEAGRVPYTIR
jgi:hypothetical protein